MKPNIDFTTPINHKTYSTLLHSSASFRFRYELKIAKSGVPLVISRLYWLWSIVIFFQENACSDNNIMLLSSSAYMFYTMFYIDKIRPKTFFTEIWSDNRLQMYHSCFSVLFFSALNPPCNIKLTLKSLFQITTQFARKFFDS